MIIGPKMQKKTAGGMSFIINKCFETPAIIAHIKHCRFVMCADHCSETVL